MKKKESFIWLYLILLVLIFIFGGVCTLVVMRGISFFKDDKNTKDNPDIVYNSCSNCKSGTTIVENGGISESVAKVYDSVVMIKIYKNNQLSGSGSGFVYKKDSKYGYVMTNYHVSDGSKKVTVLTASGEEVDATFLGGDQFLDISVLRIDVNKVISVAKIGSTEKIKLGDRVFAVGTPVGEEYFNSVTGGFISGVNRKIPVTVVTKYDWVQEVIQIDAAINPGNSGGPLFNFNGEVIGVNSMKLVNDEIEGMGFTIKIEDAMKHVDTFEKGEEIKRPYLGVSYIDVSEKTALRYNGIIIDSTIKEGVVVASVDEGKAAHKSGLLKGDVIIKFNDDKVISNAYLRYLLYKYNPGDEITITYIRNGSTATTKVTLTEK